MEIPDETARAVFDAAVRSMDFESGFLGNKDVRHLRAFAEAIGVDPWVATPSNHRPEFCPGHQWGERKSSSVQSWMECSVCGKTEYGNPTHQRDCPMVEGPGDCSCTAHGARIFVEGGKGSVVNHNYVYGGFEVMADCGLCGHVKDSPIHVLPEVSRFETVLRQVQEERRP